MRVYLIVLFAVLALSACSAPRRSVAELDTSRQEPKRAPASQYPYTWRPRQLPREPACYDAAMCYDEKREVCVLHGGRSSWWDARNTTWIWDGERWWCEEDSTHDTFAHSHAMIYRHETETPLMWGGALKYPFTKWNQWSPITECRSEQSPDRLALASDPVRKVVVVFGGLGAERKELSTLHEISKDSLKLIPFDSGPQAQSAALFINEPSMRACLLVDRIPAADGVAVRTWTWNGEKWSEKFTTGPSKVISRAQFLLYDTERACPVALCPTETWDAYELWELKNGEWLKRTTYGSPTYRQGCCAAYDQKRKMIVLHGGQMHLTDVFARDETWLCDAAGNWRCANSPAAPRPGVAGSCMCYDSSRKATVLIDELFESWADKRTSVHLREWLWDGCRWTRSELPREMPRFCSKTIVADTKRGVLWLWFEREKSNELWRFSKGKWTPVSGGLVNHSILGGVFDEERGEVVLFHEDGNAPDNETRMSAYSTWNGIRLTTYTTKGPTLDWYRTSISYDRLRQRFVVFSRSDYADGGVIWEFDRCVWTSFVLPICPWGWSCEAFVYLGAINRCVLFGGGAPMASDQVFVSEHWQWDGQRWEALQFSTVPFARSMALIAEDTDRGCLVLFGGVAYRRQYCDTWEYGPDRP